MLNFCFPCKLKDAGDGKGTAKSLLDRIAELEDEAQRSLMHRFIIFEFVLSFHLVPVGSFF